tara:strand:- start:1593 stop:1835 length:243 start_codon:yes stop_codon:yes gene_type:complete
MDFHNSSLALNEWLEWTEDYIRKPEPVKAHYCEAKNPSTNEVIWDDLLYSDEDKIKRLEEAYKSGLILVINPKAETIYEA